MLFFSNGTRCSIVKVNLEQPVDILSQDIKLIVWLRPNPNLWFCNLSKSWLSITNHINVRLILLNFPKPRLAFIPSLPCLRMFRCSSFDVQVGKCRKTVSNSKIPLPHNLDLLLPGQHVTTCSLLTLDYINNATILNGHMKGFLVSNSKIYTVKSFRIANMMFFDICVFKLFHVEVTLVTWSYEIEFKSLKLFC